jgi:hypothetical protein
MRKGSDGARREYITRRKMGYRSNQRRRITKRDTPQSLLKKTHHHIHLSLGQTFMSYLHQAHLHLRTEVIVNPTTMNQQNQRILQNIHIIQQKRRINSKSIYIQKWRSLDCQRRTIILMLFHQRKKSTKRLFLYRQGDTAA